MRLAEGIGQLATETAWTCADVHGLPDGYGSVRRWRKYLPFDGERLPFSGGVFDVSLLCDVLHHVSDSRKPALLIEAARIANVLVVKDHFEHGPFSRMALRMMDFVGNWAYGVPVPRKYFTPGRFQDCLRKAGLLETACIDAIDLYSHLPQPAKMLIKPQWQFVSVLKKANP
jgi:hypothetical protein